MLGHMPGIADSSVAADGSTAAAGSALSLGDQALDELQQAWLQYGAGLLGGDSAETGSDQALLLLAETAGAMQANSPRHAAAAAVDDVDVHPGAVVPAEHAAAAAAVNAVNVHPAAVLPVMGRPAAAAEAPDAAGNAPLASHDAVLSAAAQQVLDYEAELQEMLRAAGQAPLGG
jgi:hypothetical protein